MLQKVTPSQFAEIKLRHQERIARYPLINAIVSGIQAGFVYANPARTLVFVCTKSGFALLSGPEDLRLSAAEVFAFLRNNDEIPAYIHVYDPPASFQAHVIGSWEKHRVRRRVQFRLRHSTATVEYQKLLPRGHRIVRIQDVGCSRLEDSFHLGFAHRYWNSADQFVQNAIGVCALNTDDAPVAICYSACVVEGVAEMDTLVLPEYRGQGFMRIVSEPFFNVAIANKLTPHWDTFVANAPSYGLAQKFDMEQVYEYDLLSILLR